MHLIHAFLYSERTLVVGLFSVDEMSRPHSEVAGCLPYHCARNTKLACSMQKREKKIKKSLKIIVTIDFSLFVAIEPWS